eukprot:17322-Heterococcus_DN1.PRE.2
MQVRTEASLQERSQQLKYTKRTPTRQAAQAQHQLQHSDCHVALLGTLLHIVAGPAQKSWKLL